MRLPCASGADRAIGAAIPRQFVPFTAASRLGQPSRMENGWSGTGLQSQFAPVRCVPSDARPSWGSIQNHDLNFPVLPQVLARAIGVFTDIIKCVGWNLHSARRV